MAKGFTLVELLAVIVILAVLALIATPVVLSIIDDAKESAMLRSAEMYLSGVENAVMRENMNSGGNFRPNECTISNGKLSCKGTDVEVEVDGEVPSTGSITFENGKITQVTLNYESGTIVKDTNGNLVYEGTQEIKITITPKKETYSIGEEVVIGEEKFYVIADDAEKVTLLAKDCINPTTLVQSASAGTVVFSSTNYWSSETEYPLNLNEYTIPEGETSVIMTARTYGASLGVTGRLMTLEEATFLQTENSDILYGRNGKSSSAHLNYWLGSAGSADTVWTGRGNYNGIPHLDFKLDYLHGVRPVVEILKTKIF